MNKPILLVVAGCNGSGKSTFSKSLTPNNIIPFDYDKYFLDIYNSKSDSELRERMSHYQAFETLENSINTAILNKNSFCYETNFNSTPMHWPEIFRKNGYQIDMFYFCLDSVTEAKKRVRIRFENGGHFVPDNEIKERFYSGYENLDKHFKDFDNIHLFDSNSYDVVPTFMASFLNGKVNALNKYPEFMKALLPDISKSVKQFI